MRYTIRIKNSRNRWAIFVPAGGFETADDAEVFGRNAALPGAPLAGRHWAVFQGPRKLRGRVHRDDIRAAERVKGGR